MSTAIKIVLATVGVAVAVWCLFGFVLWDWNLSNWSEFSRLAAVTVWGMLCVCLLLFVY